jgi:hypothetical protein
MSDKKLFIVEFGEPSMPNFMSFRFGGPKPIYVVAKDYNEAANKAMLYMEAKKASMPKKSVLDEDGSLNRSMDIDEEIKIIGVRLAAEEIIW